MDTSFFFLMKLKAGYQSSLGTKLLMIPSFFFSICIQSVYALVYAIFINSALCYLLMTWSNLHLSSTLVTAFWPVQVYIYIQTSYLLDMYMCVYL